MERQVIEPQKKIENEREGVGTESIAYPTTDRVSYNELNYKKETDEKKIETQRVSTDHIQEGNYQNEKPEKGNLLDALNKVGQKPADEAENRITYNRLMHDKSNGG